MGKALIIPGADFSQNAIERITGDLLTVAELSDTPTGNFKEEIYGCIEYMQAVSGKTISKIRCITYEAGIVTLHVLNTYEIGNCTELNTVDVNVQAYDQLTEVTLPAPLEVPSGGTIVVSGPLRFAMSSSPLQDVSIGNHRTISSNTIKLVSSDTTQYFKHFIGFYGD